VLAKEPNNVRAQKLLIEARSKSQTPEQALASLKPSLDDANADPSLLAMAGRMSLASGNRDQALAYFTQAAASNDANKTPAEVQLELASGYLMAGDLDRALELLEKMPAGGATDFQRDYLTIATLLRKGDTDKAVAEAKRLVEAKGSDTQVRNLAAATFAAAGQKDAAREQFAEALKIKPSDPVTLMNLARLDLADGKAAEAEKGFLKVLDADPKNLMATLGLAAVAGTRNDRAQTEKWLTKASADHPDSVDAQLALAQYYLNTREFAKAKSVVDEAAKKSPDNAALSNARGLTQMGLNDVPGALASFKQATEQAPKAYGYALNLARGHLANRDLDAALGVVDGVLKASPQYSPALALGAAATLQAGQLEKATGYIERLRRAAPDAPGTYMLEGDLAMAQKRYPEALAHYKKASAQGSNSQLVVAQYRAATLSGAPKPEAVLEDWIARNPGDANVASVLADQRQRAGNLAGAAQLYEQGLAKSPDNVVMLNNLAVIYDLQGNAKAVDLAGRAYKAAPNAPAIADTYGWILFKQGKSDEALPLLREAHKGLPNNAEVQYHLAAVLSKKGEKGEATDLVRKALAGDLPAALKPDAQKLLEGLQ
jgi:putative PEP-CTERM system TPR-repeat lipoprotein